MKQNHKQHWIQKKAERELKQYKERMKRKQTAKWETQTQAYR